MGLIFSPPLLPKVLNQTKTETCRPRKDGDFAYDFSYDGSDILCVKRNNRALWGVSKTYAIVPGRGKSGVGFLRITGIWLIDVRDMDLPHSIAEGFTSPYGFWQTWCGFYDKPALKLMDDPSALPPKAMLATRPAHLYTAWRLRFTVIADAD